MRPDLALFNEHVNASLFQIGMDKGKWGICDDDSNTRPEWPCITIWILALDKLNCPDKYFFRFNLDGYPSPPTAFLWDNIAQKKLEDTKWPKLKSGSQVFRPADYLYLPCDRVGRMSHPEWEQVHADLWWHSGDKITKYLNCLYELLNSKDYANA